MKGFMETGAHWCARRLLDERRSLAFLGEHARAATHDGRTKETRDACILDMMLTGGFSILLVAECDPTA